MEVKINKEIRAYKASVFFGLSLRQFLWSLAAVILDVVIYFTCIGQLGTELTSWICILAAIPCAAIGFITYHGMPFEKFAWAWFCSELLEPRQLKVSFRNLHLPVFKAAMETQKIGKRKDCSNEHPGKEQEQQNEDSQVSAG